MRAHRLAALCAIALPWSASTTENCGAAAAHETPADARGLRQVYFLPVPSAASTTFTRLLRRFACELNNRTDSAGCCLGGGLTASGMAEAEARWCSASCTRPSCAALVGCDFCECRATPQLRQLTLPHAQRPMTVALLRHPIARFVSQYFLKQKTAQKEPERFTPDWLKAKRYLSKITKYESFGAYVAGPEHQNVMTKMFSRGLMAHKHPLTAVGAFDLDRARENLRKMDFVGIAEALDLAIELLAREINITIPNGVKQETSQLRLAPSVSAARDYRGSLISRLRRTPSEMDAVTRANELDLELYSEAHATFCAKLDKLGITHKVRGQLIVCHRPVTSLMMWLENPRCVPSPGSLFQSPRPQMRWNTAHFVHIPKCGGTTFGRMMRRLVCAMNDFGPDLDCCIEPEQQICDTDCPSHNQPDCQALWGCRFCDCRHTPQIRHMELGVSVVILRNPIHRIISAFYFQGHSPNWDRFGVRDEFVEGPESWPRINGTRAPPFSFRQYLEFPEYQNIASRMLAYDSFPYRNLTVGAEQLELALSRLSKFRLVALMEAFDASVFMAAGAFEVETMSFEALTRAKPRRGAGRNSSALTVTKLKSSRMPSMTKVFGVGAKTHEVLAKDERVTQLISERNAFDLELYQHAKRLFCDKVPEFQRAWMPDLATMGNVPEICGSRRRAL